MNQTDACCTKRTFATLLVLFLLGQGTTAHAERIELRLGGEIHVIDDAVVSTGADGGIVIEARQALPVANHTCEIWMGGAQRLEIGSVIADHVSIRMDGNSRVSVEALTCGTINAVIDGFSKIDG